MSAVVEIKCLNCGEKCFIPRWKFKKRGYGFCNRSCISKYYMNKNHPFKGKHHTEESKQKMSKKLKGKVLSEERKQNLSNAFKGEKSYRWKGGKTRHGGGYVLINTGDNNKRQELEHYLVMEQALGRPLKRTEVIHHIDGDKTNNKMENLKLCSGQSEHARINPLSRDKNGKFVKSPLYQQFPIQQWPDNLRKEMGRE